MKKNEINGRSLKKAYRRHCAKKKLKLRAKRFENWFGHDFNDRTRIKSWGEIWQEIQEGKYGRWMNTTGTPCSCEGCSPTFVRESRSKIKKEIYNTIFEDDETEGLTHLAKL